MGFPPGFTGVWDITQPPDTQLANLLGQDLRTFRNDIMQRLSLLSGVFANRPTPETMNATWGGVGFGLLYFSTDTNQIFQWNGAAWVDITSSFQALKVFFKDTTAHAHTGTTTLDTIYTVPIPANTMGTNGVLRGSLLCNPNTQSGALSTLSMSFGGFQFFNASVNTPEALTIDFTIANRGVTNAQILGGFSVGSFAFTPIGGTAAINTTVTQNLVVQFQNGANADAQTFDMLMLELL